MSFIEELKRRNVFRVGIAYVIGGWLLLQLTDVLSELLDLPDVVGRIVVMAVVIGLPVTLFFAWVFEMTPEGIKKEKDVDRSQSVTPVTGQKLNKVIIGVLVLALSYFAIDKFILTPDNAQPGTDHFSQTTTGQPANSGEKSALSPSEAIAQAESEAEPTVSRQSIAVLPFANRSRKEDDEFFVEGIHDDLLTNLSRISALKVISRTSVLRYKDTELPIPEIAATLGVATIMEGAVQRSGNTVRINVQLIDAKTDEHLWAEIYDRELTAENLFAIQTEISRSIAEALKATLSPEEQERVDDRPTENLAAYSAYLRGRQLIARRTSETVDLALVEFRRAVELDPQFALAWVGIAEAAALALLVSDLDRPEAVKISQEAVEQALAINDRLGEVQLALARLIRLERRGAAAQEAALKLATEFSPGYAQAWQAYSEFASNFPQRLQEALEMAERAAELDPLSTAIQNQVIDVLSQLGNFEEARLRLSRLIEQDPGFAASYGKMAEINRELGQFDESIKWLHKAQSLDPGNIRFVLSEMWPQMDIGNTSELDGLLRKMEVLDPDSSTLSFMEIFINIYKVNHDAAIEAARLFEQKTGYQPLGKFPQLWVHSQNNEQQVVRDIGEAIIPAFYDPGTFQQALELRPTAACRIAWSLVQTGAEELGIELAQYTIEYSKANFPGEGHYLNNAMCHVVSSQPEQALALIENAVGKRRISGWWQELSHPAYQLLRHDPRFMAANAEIQSIVARQRENLARVEAGAGS